MQAARLRDESVARHGEDGAFPGIEQLRTLTSTLPGRKSEYLRAVADTALTGRLGGARLRCLDPDEAVCIAQGPRARGVH